MALRRDLPGGGYILMTDDGGSRLPDDGPTIVGVYGEDGDMAGYTVFDNKEAARKFVEGMLQ